VVINVGRESNDVLKNAPSSVDNWEGDKIEVEYGSRFDVLVLIVLDGVTVVLDNKATALVTGLDSRENPRLMDIIAFDIMYDCSTELDIGTKRVFDDSIMADDAKELSTEGSTLIIMDGNRVAVGNKVETEMTKTSCKEFEVDEERVGLAEVETTLLGKSNIDVPDDNERSSKVAPVEDSNDGEGVDRLDPEA